MVGVFVCAGGVTMAAVLLAGSPRARRLRSSSLSQARAQRLPVALIALAVVVIVIVAASGVVAQWTAFIVAAGELAATIGWLLARGVSERRGLVNERLVTRACGMIAGQLDAGEIPTQALLSAAEDVALLGPAAGAVLIGGDVPAELNRLAERPGCAGLAWLAHGWRLSETTGMSLSPVTRRVADRLRHQSDIRDQRLAELSTAKATSRLMAFLPLVGIGMGFIVDADPLNFLFSTTAGHLCLVGAATTICAGLLWTTHLSRETP